MNHNLSILSVKINIKEKSAGSGYLYMHNKADTYVYVFTAKHCIYGMDFKDIVSNSDICLFFGRERVRYDLTDVDNVMSDEGNETDIAMIRIAKSNILKFLVDIPTTCIAVYHEMYTKCLFKGFPAFQENGQAISDEVTIVSKDSSEDEMQVITRIDYSDENNYSKDNVKGFSGSGLIVEENGRLFLLGIICKYNSASKRFSIAGIKNWVARHIYSVPIYDIELETMVPDSLFSDNILISSERLGIRFSKDFSYPVRIMQEFDALV